MKTVDDGKAADWLLSIPLHQWARHAFNEDAKTDDITNNMTESFNAWIGKVRGLPIVKILDAIRQKSMVRLHKRFAKSCTWEGELTPMAKQKLNQIIKESRKCSLLPGNNDEFEVKDGIPKYAVKLREKKCSCQHWPILGMPCKHAALCIGYKRGKIQDYCHDFYYVKTYQAAYGGVLHPLPEIDLTTAASNTYILPLKLKRNPGRPRKERIRQVDKEVPSGERKRPLTVRCKTCKHLGHNKRSCQHAPVAARVRIFSVLFPLFIIYEFSDQFIALWQSRVHQLGAAEG